jgi:hypothetical protein
VGLLPKGRRAWEAGPDPSIALWVQGNVFGGAVFGDHPVLMRPMGLLEIVKQAAAYAVSLALVSPERLARRISKGRLGRSRTPGLSWNCLLSVPLYCGCHSVCGIRDWFWHRMSS